MEQDRLVEDARSGASGSLSLCEALDRVLHKGVALRGDIVLSVACIILLPIKQRENGRGPWDVVTTSM